MRWFLCDGFLYILLVCDGELLVCDGFSYKLLACGGFFMHIVSFRIIFSMKRVMCMFGGMVKNLWGLRVCLLKSKKYTSEKSKKMPQVHLFTTTANNFPSLRCFCARKLVVFVV